MATLYAFCREIDDIADDEQVKLEERASRLQEWRTDLRRAYANSTPTLPVIGELKPVIEKYHLPFEHFDELIRGVEMDLAEQRYQDYERLELYCYRVASIVGLLSIEIFGYRNPACREYAVYLGKALQLTNILRDVQTDARKGRIYLPQEELARAKVSSDEILRGSYSPGYRGVAHAVGSRAKGYYALARRTLPPEDRRSMVAAELMGSVYWRLLQKLAAREYNVFGPEPVRLGKIHKSLLILRSWWLYAVRSSLPNYGTPSAPDRKRG